MYINLLTDDYIPNESVVRADSDGLTYYENGSWKFLGKGEYTEARDSAASGSKSSASLTTITSTEDEILQASKETKTEAYEYYTSYFGLNDFVTANKSFASASGAVSDEISVEKDVPLHLYADVACDTSKANVEFSILDGTKETPILPDDQDTVEHEKVFFMLPTRFVGTNLRYYRDGAPLGTKMTDGAMTDGATYTVSYKPDIGSYEVTPASDKVRIKTIIRVYDADAKMPEVKNIRLGQGGE